MANNLFMKYLKTRLEKDVLECEKQISDAFNKTNKPGLSDSEKINANIEYRSNIGIKVYIEILLSDIKEIEDKEQ